MAEGVVAELTRHLRAALPAEVAEIALPALRLRAGRGRVLAVACSPAWRPVLHRLVADEARRFLAARGIELQLAIAGDAAPAPAASGSDLAGFLPDPGNQLALAAARRVIEAPGLEHNPLYLHGPAGCGKSHLVAAVVGEYRAVLGEADCALAVDGAGFVAEWAQQLAERREDGLRARIAAAALVAVDGVDALAGHQLAQEELFHLVNACLDRGQQLLFTGREPPRRLAGFEERLATRLGWGLAVAVELPHPETRIALLRRLAGAAAPDDAAAARLVESSAPDMHRVVALARQLAEGEAPEALRAGEGAASFDRIVRVVAARCGLRAGDLTGQRRHQGVARARALALMLGRRLTGHSLEALGGMVGGRSHATVLHAVRQAEERVAADPALRRELEGWTQEILG